MMKKLLFSLSLLLLIGGLTSQSHAQIRPELGIRGGINFANLNDTDLDTDTRTALLAGVYANFAIPNSPVSIQPEVLYNQKGYSDGDNTLRLDYIQIPVLARFDFILDNPNLTPHVFFGPALGFNVNAEAENDFAAVGLEDSVNDTEFGVVVGGGLDFGRIDIGVRYDAGLTAISDDFDAKNGVFSVTAGIGF